MIISDCFKIHCDDKQCGAAITVTYVDNDVWKARYEAADEFGWWSNSFTNKDFCPEHKPKRKVSYPPDTVESPSHP